MAWEAQVPVEGAVIDAATMGIFLRVLLNFLSNSFRKHLYEY